MQISVCFCDKMSAFLTWNSKPSQMIIRRLLFMTFGFLASFFAGHSQPIAALFDAEDGIVVARQLLLDHQKIGDWRTARDNKYGGTGDFNNDGLTDIILTSDWGIGLLTCEEGKWKCLAAQKNGFGIGEYAFNSATDEIRGICDLDGDGKDELVAYNNWGVGILQWNEGVINVIYAAPDGTDFNGWKLRVDQDRVLGTGDTDGDKKEDLVLSSNWGIGILRYKNGKLDNLAMAPNGTTFDKNITFTTFKFKGIGAGDFDGDGLTEFIVAGDEAILFLRFHNFLIESVISIRKGTTIENFREVNPAEDKIELIADLDGNLRDDFIIKGFSDMGYIKRSQDGFKSFTKFMAGTRAGEKRIAMEDRVIGAGDFNGDRIMDIVLGGEMGLNILTEEGGIVNSLGSTQFPGNIGDWQMEATDDIVTIGQFGKAGDYCILVRKSQ